MANNLDSVVVYFSTGKDSAAMLSLFQKFMPGRYSPVFLYYYKNLEIRESVLRHYEQRFNINFLRLPQYDKAAKTINTKIKQADIDAYCRDYFKTPWVAYGYKALDSLARRGMLWNTDNGIDWKYKKLYPLYRWSDKQVMQYIIKNNLPIAPDYAYGYRDINVFKGEAVVWLYKNYRADYERIRKQEPDIEGELIRAQNVEQQIRKVQNYRIK